MTALSSYFGENGVFSGTLHNELKNLRTSTKVQVGKPGRPFHPILNVAVGGMWGGSGGGIDDSVFPQKMPVDCVRVYEQKP